MSVVDVIVDGVYSMFCRTKDVIEIPDMFRKLLPALDPSAPKDAKMGNIVNMAPVAFAALSAQSAVLESAADQLNKQPEKAQKIREVAR